jgi:hypothetical protein
MGADRYLVAAVADFETAYAQWRDGERRLRDAPPSDQPWAWDPRVVVDAAFARYVRGARDFAGGRRVED